MMDTLPWLSFKDTSSLDLGLYIANKNSFNAPSRDMIFQNIPGRSGDLIIDNGRFNNITITYGMSAIASGEQNFTELAYNIKNWLLSESGYFRLYDSYDTDHFRYAAYSDGTEIEQELRQIGNTSLSFNCKPFRYSFDGQNTITLSEPDTIQNAEQFTSYPYIKITGSGDITLTVGAGSYLFSGVDEYIELDSEAMIAYKGIVNQNNNMHTPNFPKFASGDNPIAWVGNVESIEIVPRWCCL
ncbi:MAG: hypothetical protein LBL82_00170 [Oscillospiraceae bacterium]|jgi:phage-related protein|nr:hypothetical protein [Oscillospiraceae bacterium]